MVGDFSLPLLVHFSLPVTLVLRKLVVNVLVLDRLGVKSICDTADAVWEHPLIRDAVLRRNLLFIGLVRPGDGGFDLLSLGAGQFSLFR